MVSVYVWGHVVWMGVVRLCPPIRDDIVTPRHLFHIGCSHPQYTKDSGQKTLQSIRKFFMIDFVIVIVVAVEVVVAVVFVVFLHRCRHLIRTERAISQWVLRCPTLLGY